MTEHCTTVVDDRKHSKGFINWHISVNAALNPTWHHHHGSFWAVIFWRGALPADHILIRCQVQPIPCGSQDQNIPNGIECHALIHRQRSVKEDNWLVAITAKLPVDVLNECLDTLQQRLNFRASLADRICDLWTRRLKYYTSKLHNSILVCRHNMEPVNSTLLICVIMADSVLSKRDLNTKCFFNAQWTLFILATQNVLLSYCTVS